MALNLYVIRSDKGAAGDFYHKLRQQMAEQYQGLYLASPDGKLLVKKTLWSKESGKSWPETVLQGLKEGLGAFGPVKARPQSQSAYLQNRGCGQDKQGRVILAVSTKLILVPQLPIDLADLSTSAIPETGHDSIMLGLDEFNQLFPAKAAGDLKGDMDRSTLRWTVPEATARKFFPVLDNWDKRFRKLEEVTAVQLTGKVRSVRHGIAYLNYEGRIAGKRVWMEGTGREAKETSLRGEAELLAGVAAYDLQAGKLLSLTLVFKGRTGKTLADPGQGGRYGAVVEWRRHRPRQ
ncbi:MAG TPA: hypothetical protein VH682_13525 [Gemmataceae bacterium]